MGEESRHARLLALGEIAAEIAHELRNALQIVSTNAYLAQKDPAASAPHLAKIERSARLAQGIVDDLMALARGEATRSEPTPLAEILALSRELLPPAALAVFQDDVPEGHLVRAHPGLLARLFHALYDNSIRVGAQRIVTRVDAAGIEVSDDGPGVPDAIRATLFTPLVTERAGGSGLGLALARRVAEAHGGSLVLAPSQRGATFRLELPR